MQHASSMELALASSNGSDNEVKVRGATTFTEHVEAPASDEVTELALLVAIRRTEWTEARLVQTAVEGWETSRRCRYSLDSARSWRGSGRTAHIRWWSERYGATQNNQRLMPAQRSPERRSTASSVKHCWRQKSRSSVATSCCSSSLSGTCGGDVSLDTAVARPQSERQNQGRDQLR